MGFAETIKKIKELSQKLQSKHIADREIIHYTSELHRHIDNLDVPQLIGQDDDDIFRNILHN
tara:strand:+ start:272 stop:457 length:186 start_codon:yes stop_codon:yes gene_type:complete